MGWMCLVIPVQQRHIIFLFIIDPRDTNIALNLPCGDLVHVDDEHPEVGDAFDTCSFTFKDSVQA